MNDWTPEEDEAFNEVEKQSNLGKRILKEIRPQRTWVGLTDEERERAIPFKDLSGEYYYDDVLNILLFVEAKLKQKNE
jgi:hypothetical protein